MAIVKGSSTGNTLNGVGIENDIIYGLGGNDTINGGAGNDTLYGEAPFFQGKYYLFSIAGTWVAAQADAVSVGGSLVTVNNVAENQWLTTNFTGQGNLWLGLTDQTVEGTFAWINGETTTATYRNWSGGQQPVSVTGLEDYASLTIASGLWTALPNTTSQLGIIEIATVLTGNDSLDGGTGLDTLVGGVGNDTLNGGAESDTADYSSLTQAITLLPTGVVNKGTAGTDNLISVERIIGAAGRANVIDASTATNFGATATVNINLADQSAFISTGIATPPSISLSIVNFVNAIGTNNNDTITGDTANNTLSGGGGNDILNGGTGGNDTLNGGIGNDSLIGGTGSDRLDGGTGTDTADYSALGQAITLLPTGTVNKGIAGTDQLVGIETVIGATGLINVIDASTATNFGAAATVNINLATQSVVVTTGIATPPSISLSVVNFVNAIGTNNNDTITGNTASNTLSGGGGNDTLNGGTGGNDTLNGGIGNDSLIGGTGSDRLDGGTGTDTADYSALTQAITLLPTGTVNKGITGTDQLVGIETVIGATGLANVIDASTATNFGAAATVNINLATQSVLVNTGIATPPSISLTAINFVNAIGTNNNDTITGSTANNTLSGGSGNDTLDGGSGNDSLNGGIGNDQIFGDQINLPSEFFSYNGKLYLLSNAGTWTQAQAQAVSLGGNLVTVNNEAENQFLVDTFGEEALWIGLTDEVVEGQFKWVNGEAFTYNNWDPGQPDGGGEQGQDYAYINFNFFDSGNLGTWDDTGNDAGIRGIIEIYSNDTIIGSTGNDTINGGVGTDTANYSAIGQAITLLPTGTVNKGIAGTDQLIGIETIIGATGLANVIDASTATNFGADATININLATQSVVVTTGIETSPSISLSVVNFINAIGTNNNDTIIGDIANNTLSGENGDDSLNGGTGNDNLNGGAGNDQIFGDLTSPFFSFNGKTYLLSNAGSWTEAQAQAVSLGGNLVTVNDAAENQFLVNTFGTERLWIGLTDQAVEGQFRWANGEAFTYNNWNVGQPDDFRDQEKDGGIFRNGEDYVEINFVESGKWNDLPNNALSLRGIIEIAALSNDTIIGSTGKDTINGGFGTDTVNYTGIGEAVTLLATGILDKGGAGIDELISIETIIGEAGQANTIDSSTATGTTKVNVNLTTGSLVVNADGIPTPLSFTVTNFVNVFGTDNNDTITGSSADNALNGKGGNDILIGSGGDDLINGGLGTDILNYSSLTDAITLLSSGVVNKGIFGTDQIFNIETVIGATGQLNTIDASTGVATTTSLNADLAMNRLTINGLPEPINSVTFNVQNFVNIVGTTQGDTLKGNSLANELVGNSGNDTIQGNNGDDILDGGDGNDQLLGGENNDQLYGGLGNDILQGDNGNDLLFADLGNDTLRGGNGDDILDGGVGNDSLLGGANNDTLYGDVGDDILNGEAGNDLLYGEAGNDRIFGGEGNDQLSGDQGRDLLYGGNGNDVLFGNEDNDSLFGDAGDDLLFGGKGNDLLQGGLGNDTFAFFLGEGFDTIQDFQDGFDKIGLGGLEFSQLTISQVGANTFIRNTSNGEFLFNLQNIALSLITSADFVTVTV